MPLLGVILQGESSPIGVFCVFLILVFMHCVWGNNCHGIGLSRFSFRLCGPSRIESVMGFQQCILQNDFHHENWYPLQAWMKDMSGTAVTGFLAWGVDNTGFSPMCFFSFCPSIQVVRTIDDFGLLGDFVACLCHDEGSFYPVGFLGFIGRPFFFKIGLKKRAKGRSSFLYFTGFLNTFKLFGLRFVAFSMNILPNGNEYFHVSMPFAKHQFCVSYECSKRLHPNLKHLLQSFVFIICSWGHIDWEVLYHFLIFVWIGILVKPDYTGVEHFAKDFLLGFMPRPPWSLKLQAFNCAVVQVVHPLGLVSSVYICVICTRFAVQCSCCNSTVWLNCVVSKGNLREKWCFHTSFLTVSSYIVVYFVLMSGVDRGFLANNLDHHWNKCPFGSIVPSIFSSTHLLFIISKNFDSSLGFPGEGPECKQWCCSSANIESIHSHPDCLEWPVDLTMLQETRLTSINIQECQKRAQEHGKNVFVGALLQEKPDKNGLFKSPHGGTAILASGSLCRPFIEADDSTGIWTSLKKQTRISGVWCQVLPKLRVLCWSIYGYTQNADGSYRTLNDFLLQQIFLISSQFGDIPVIVGGDFQCDPNELDAFVSAKIYGWVDPVMSFDQVGGYQRPLTYSRSSNFVNPSECFSSIDGILMNEVAFGALQSIHVDHQCGRPHAPIHATFEWHRVFLKGTVLVKPPPFDLSTIKRKDNAIDVNHLQDLAVTNWSPDLEASFMHGDDNQAWSIVNKFAQDIFVKAGAKLPTSEAQRGQLPVFRQKTVCPGQDAKGNALTSLSAKLSKIYNLVTELRHRKNRQGTTTGDFLNTWNLQNKVLYHLTSFSEFKKWTLDYCDDASLACIQKSLQTSIQKNRDKEKRKRINSWKSKMQEGTASKKVAKFVYQWINAKIQSPSPNLIKDSQGNIVADPERAMQLINEQWDEVYSANVLHEHPQKILEVIWPKLVERRMPVNLPVLTGETLQYQVGKRRKDAAAGLDGWQTAEMQILPRKIFDIVAVFFKQVEDGTRSLPTILTSTRQILLDKCGDDNPMQKRIISVFPIFIIAYTSARFHQLQHWQNQIMPKNLFGGIKTRKMAQLQTAVKLHIDQASVDSQPLAGLKLDKSKCFDRLIPATTSALFLAVGIPKTLVTFFVCMYQGLRRYLSYKTWTSSNYTTSANGLVQGCSLSLLAINVHMMIWSIFLEQFPEVTASAFIDDAYLFAKIRSIDRLNDALHVTDWWDNLTGQLANTRKTVVWATSSKARFLMKQEFPGMSHKHCVDVLGAALQTTSKIEFGWDTMRTDKVLKELRLIRAIPTSRVILEHIIATKIVPQISHAAHISMIPKKQIKSVQDGIVEILWKRKPMWRARPLVLCFLSKPHRTDPVLARSYNAIIECVTFLRTCSPQDRVMWSNHFANQSHPLALVTRYRQACAALKIECVSAFHLRFFEADPVCVLDFGTKEIKTVLQIACRDSLYQEATLLHRKDIKPAIGFLDYHGSTLAHNKCKNITVNGSHLLSFRESSLVGCNSTNDRRAKSGLTDSNVCRFCGGPSETLDHLVHQCPNPPCSDLKPCQIPDAGPNFPLLGIAEIPIEQSRRRLRASKTSDIPVSTWSENSLSSPRKIWTDGSCLDGENFWYCRGGCAAVDDLGNCLFQTEVHHLALSSYSCELWAIIQAFCRATGPCECRSDCQAVVSQIHHMILHQFIPTTWLHYEWWTFFLHIFTIRLLVHPQPLVATWIPSHILDGVPCYAISTLQAKLAGSSWENIYGNRMADRYAKEAISSTQGNVVDRPNPDHITKWQIWLAHVNAKLGEISSIEDKQNPESHFEDAPVEANAVACPSDSVHNCVPSEITIAHPISVYQKVLPLWAWYPDDYVFNWKATFPIDVPLKSYASISSENWSIALSFLVNLSWECKPQHQTSYIELAFAAWCSGVYFEGVECTPKDYSRVLRKTINQCFKMPQNGSIVPGVQKAAYKSRGRTLPAGFIQGAWPFIPASTLKRIALCLFQGKSQRLSDWGFPFS